MTTQIGHHYDDADDVRRSISAIAFRNRGSVLGSLAINGFGSALYFADAESIDAFIAGLRTLQADMAALEASDVAA